MIVVTAGHVDHGKSTLVRSITGTDPDRLPEERRRGLTIDLGFAFAELPSGRPLALVDVPGHERFVRTMLSGCGGVDAALLVVSAREGWMPQTEEHLQILGFAGIAHGVVALTFVDGLGRDSLVPVENEVRSRLAGSPLERAAILPTSPNDAGSIGELTKALDDVSRHCERPRSVEAGRPRLWVDRSFTLAGRGRIVTGTLAGGSIDVADRLAVVSGKDRGAVRVRSLHENGCPVTTARPGHRVAVNIVGDLPPPERGSALVAPEQWTTCSTVHASLSLVRSMSSLPSARRSYRLFVGTTSVAARLRYLDPPGGPGGPGGQPALVRLRCSEELGPVSIGDRYVLRDESTQETIGGGVLLALDEQIAADRHDELRHRADLLGGRRPSTGLADVAASLVRGRGGPVPTSELTALVGPVRHPLLVDVGGATVLEGQESPPAARPRRGVDPRDLTVGLAAILGYLEGCSPPFARPSEIARNTGVPPVVRQTLIRSSQLVEIGPFLIARSTFDDLAGRVERDIRLRGGSTVAALRTATGLSRKYLLPLLECLDARGVTTRSGDIRLRGRATTHPR